MSSMLMLLCVCWFGLVAASPTTPYALEQAELHFERFIQEYDRHYADEHEKQARFTIFKENLEKINHKNENSKSAVYGVSQFSDQTLEELHQFLNCLKTDIMYNRAQSCSTLTDADIPYNDAPEAFDWREHGAVSEVKDQKQCGSCYAFSATGNIEGQYAIKHKQLVEVSEQQIVDCDTLDFGCDGGYMGNVFAWLLEAGGIETESDYPYIQKQYKNECHFNKSQVTVTLTDCHTYSLTSQEKLKQLLYHNGPISIAIKAAGIVGYQTGIISDKDCDVNGINHGVLLVGYGTENGEDYWLVKNSWNDGWGDHGYFKMHRGEGALSCGVMNELMASAVVA